ncbi:UPF0488 protein CG14286 [Venturia canescens]|uniref:UPF0488 protein CG14286 n=1 Tax=Venturia canescens TaxID=32260 RepID=UPI001C9C9D89|nr:UPF0488 protein CG14286 [Venturia canescens]
MPPKYKPGGKKFPPKSTLKPLPKQVNNHLGSPFNRLESATSLEQQEVENQLELELCWCIEQLHISLGSGKLNEKQALESKKTLTLLKNNSVAFIRKRQVMRNTFGDYRAKMIQDEKKYGKYVANVQFAEPKVVSNKSVFLRKATTETPVKKSCEEKCSNNKEKEGEDLHNVKKLFVMSKETSDVPFTFNFSVPEPE